ncbi:MAG: 50S ribosomal protein L35 [Chloroflexi bacterium]|nr:50S ribosomal protein L35 [Chloroflexota bacterium]
MPKIKTHKATSKRFKVTATGKVMRTKIGKSHLRRRKSKRNKRMFDRRIPVELHENTKKIKALAPTMDQK